MTDKHPLLPELELWNCPFCHTENVRELLSCRSCTMTQPAHSDYMDGLRSSVKALEEKLALAEKALERISGADENVGDSRIKRFSSVDCAAFAREALSALRKGGAK